MKIPSAFFVAALLALPPASGADPDKAAEHKNAGDAAEPEDSSHKEAAGYISGKVAWPKDPARAQDKAVALTIQLMLNDPNAAAALWTNFLTNAAKRTGAGGKADPDAVASLHQSLMPDLADTAVGIPAMAQFLGKVDRASAVSEAFGTWEGILNQAFAERFQGFPQVMDEVTEQHIFQTDCLRHLVRFFQATAKDTPEEARPALAAFGLHHFFNEYWYQEYWNDRRAAVQWADTTLKPLHPLLADVMVMAILSSDQGKLNKQQDAELRERTLRFANSPDLGSVDKISVLSQMIQPSEHRRFDHPELVQALARAMAEYLSPQRPLTDPKTIRLLAEITDYSSLSKQDAALISTRLRASRIAGGLPPGADEATQAQFAQLRLNLALLGGNPAEIPGAVAAAGAQIHGRIDVALKLWKAGQGKLAAAVVAGPDEYSANAGNYFIETLPSYFVPPVFTREIEAGLPGWLESIEDREQRFRVECVISSLADAPGADAPQEQRETRVNRLIDRFAAEGPHARAARVETLTALSLSVEKSILLRDEMDRMVSDLDMEKLMSEARSDSASQDGMYEAEVLIRRGIRYRLETDGDAGYLLKQVRSISGIGGKGMSGWDMRGDLHSFFSFYAALLCRKIVESQPEKQPALLEDSRKICESFLGCSERYAQGFGPGLVIMTHAAGNAGAALDAWHDKLPAKMKEAYDYARKRYGLPNNLRIIRAYPLADPAMTTQRREILKRFLCDQATIKREFNTPSEVSYMLDFEVFSKDDFFAVLDELPKDNPMRVKFFTEKAGMLGNRLGTEQEAMAAFDAAEKMAKESSDPTDLAYVLAIKAKYFGDDLHRPEQAEALIKTIDPKFLDQREKDWIEEFSAKQKR